MLFTIIKVTSDTETQTTGGTIGIEIERKFFQRNSDWRELVEKTLVITQGFIAREDGNMVRVRTTDTKELKKAEVCIKGSYTPKGVPEFEYPVSFNDAAELLKLCGERVMSKHRHHITHEGNLFEIDEFKGKLTGLVLIELELNSPEQTFVIPQWVGPEVTGNTDYFNSRLISGGIPKSYRNYHAT